MKLSFWVSSRRARVGPASPGRSLRSLGTKEGLFAFSTYSCLVRVYSQLLVTLSWQQLELKVDSEADGIAGKQSIQTKETRGFP